MTASHLIRSAAFALGALAFCAGPAYAEGAAAAGKKVFRKCAACHTVQAGKNRVRPSLADIFDRPAARSEEHTSEILSLMRLSTASFCLDKTNHNKATHTTRQRS